MALRLPVVLAAALGGLLVPLTDLRAADFVGPFPSWKNVRTDYGAVGDGKADDTAAFQKALTDLQFHKDFCVLYVPAGTYRITQTLKVMRKAHKESMGISLLGEDPARTVLRWDGPSGGILLQYAAWYSRIGRLTLDGRERAQAALAYGPGFSTYNETADMIFRDAQIGLSLGLGEGQAEQTVARCQFLNCGTGVQTNSFNSMDIWVWHCLFDHCGRGLYNGAGNFHAYFNVFKRSKKADIGTANLMVFSFHGNTSLNSKCFLDFDGGQSWSAPTSITANHIYHPTGGYALKLGNGGPYLVMDNVIRTLPSYRGPLVKMTWGDQTFLGNTYATPFPKPVVGKGHFLQLDEREVSLSAVDPRVPKLPAMPPRREAPVFEVPAGASAAQIQEAIDRAARQKGRRPVVHLPMGTYAIRQTLVVPAGCDVQVLGDGGAETATVLTWAGPAGGTIFHLEGPSRAALGDLFLQADRGSGVHVTRADQAGGRVLADQVNVSGRGGKQPGQAGLRVRGIKSGDVLCRGLQGGTGVEHWVDVADGPDGDSARARVTVLTGASSTPVRTLYQVTRGGRLLVRSVYHEQSTKEPRALQLTGAGRLTLDATRFSYFTTRQEPTLQLDSFQGQLCLNCCLFFPVGSKEVCRIAVTGKGAGTRLLCLNSTFWVNEPGATSEGILANQASPPAEAGLLECNLNSQPKRGTEKGFAYLTNRGQASAEFLRQMLRPIHDCPAWPDDPPGAPLVQGLTDVSLRRVMAVCGSGGVGVAIDGQE